MEPPHDSEHIAAPIQLDLQQVFSDGIVLPGTYLRILLELDVADPCIERDLLVRDLDEGADPEGKACRDGL